MATEWIVRPAEYDHEKSPQENKYRHRGTVRCGCGQDVDVGPAMYGPNYAASCPNNKHYFNLVGQELNPPSQWEENGDDY